MKDIFTFLFAGLSFLLSVFTLWVTQFRHGRLKMTQPTLLCLKRELPSGRLKIFLRTLLYTTASKGRVIESIYLRVHQSAGTYVFDFWGHTEGGKLTLGSGLFVGQTGIACDHHFNLRHESDQFLFCEGEYRVEIFAVVVGKPKPIKLKELTFLVNGQQAAEFIQITDRALFLLWNAEKRTYEGRVESSLENRSSRFVPWHGEAQ